jgi:hypothetical protein
MNTDVKSSSTVAHSGLVAKENTEAQPKGVVRIGSREEREGSKTDDSSEALALLDLHSGQNQGGLPPNGTFSLWDMLMAIMKYEKTLLDNNAQMQKNYAQTLGGKTGVFATLYTVGCNIGEKDAESMRDDAFGKFAQAGVAGGSLLASGAKYGFSTRPAINAGNETSADATAFQKSINESPAALRIKAAPSAPPAEAPHVDADVQARVDGWADGSQPIENFKGLDKDGNVDAAQKQLNDRAASHVANDPAKRAKIQKRIDKQKESGSSQINNADQSFNTFQNLNSTATQGLQNVANAGAGIAGSDAAKQKGQYNAAQTVISQAQQGIVQSENTAERNAQEALQQANQWAQGFASAASSQVHA